MDRRAGGVAPLMAVLTAAVLLVAPSGAAARGREILRAPLPVVALAADKHRVAVTVGRREMGTDSIRVFDVASGRRWTIPGGGTNQGFTGPYARVNGLSSLSPTLALAGSRLAWREYDAGNLTYDRLFTATLGTPVPRELTSAPGEVHDAEVGSFLGGVAGDGSTLVHSRFAVEHRDPADCEDPDRNEVPGACLPEVRGGALLRVVGTRRRVLERGPDAIDVQAADAGRVAGIRRDGTVALVGVRRGVLAAFGEPAAPPALAVALHGARLVVLRRDNRLLVYSTSGGLLRTLRPARSAAGPIDVHAGILVYRARRSIRAIRLTDGRERVVALLPRAVRGPHDIAGVQIDDAGLTYAYNLPGRRWTSTGHVVAVRLRDVRGLLAR